MQPAGLLRAVFALISNYRTFFGSILWFGISKLSVRYATLLP